MEHENVLFRLIKNTSIEQKLFENLQQTLTAYKELMMILVKLTKLSQDELKQSSSQANSILVPKETLNKQRQDLLKMLEESVQEINRIVTRTTETDQEMKETEVLSRYGETMYVEPTFYTAEYVRNCTNLRQQAEAFYFRLALVQKQLALRRALIQQLQDKLPENIKIRLLYLRQIAYSFDDIPFSFSNQLMKNVIIQFLSQQKEKIHRQNINFLFFVVNQYYFPGTNHQKENDKMQFLEVFSNYLLLPKDKQQPTSTVNVSMHDIAPHQPQTISNQANVLKEQILIQLVIESIHNIIGVPQMTKIYSILQEVRNNIFSIKLPIQLDKQEMLTFQKTVQQQIVEEKLKVPFYSLNSNFINACKFTQASDSLVMAICKNIISSQSPKIYTLEVGKRRYVVGELKGFAVGYLEFL